MTGRVRRVALTGGIATGKSHVRAEFERRGVATIDADRLARDAVAPGTEGYAAVVSRFGPGIVDRSGALDRRALGSIIFADPTARRDLEAIVHPEVRRLMDAWFETLDPVAHPFAVADIPLLFEAGRERDFDAVVVAACDPETQVRRIITRDQLTEADARQRLAAQLPIDEKIRRADYVIDTNGTIEDTNAQVKDVAQELGRQAGGPVGRR